MVRRAEPNGKGAAVAAPFPGSCVPASAGPSIAAYALRAALALIAAAMKAAKPSARSS